jgi:hypothetical protein
MDVVTKAMKKEWWYDMFDVDRSQFDVRFRTKIISYHIFFLIRSNFRVNLNYSEQF